MKPFITFEGQGQAAIDLYQSIFPSFQLDSIQHHAAPHDSLIMMAKFSIQGRGVMISDSPISHEWEITPGISFFLEVESVEVLQGLSERLAVAGKVMMPAGNYGFSTMFTWVEDQFGVNWQLNVN